MVQYYLRKEINIQLIAVVTGKYQKKEKTFIIIFQKQLHNYDILIKVIPKKISNQQMICPSFMFQGPYVTILNIYVDLYPDVIK